MCLMLLGDSPVNLLQLSTLAELNISSSNCIIGEDVTPAAVPIAYIIF